jgi:hypothetical protein
MGVLERCKSPFYPLERVASVIEFDEVWGVCLIGVFPSVVAFGVSFPFDEVLELSRLSLTPVAFDLLHFIFLFPIN